jgi:hypothetical protein
VSGRALDVGDVPAGGRELRRIGGDAMGDGPELGISVQRPTCPRLDQEAVAADPLERGLVRAPVADDSVRPARTVTST